MTLVLYFSKKGENFSDGGMKKLNIGNTEVVAKKIATQLNCDICEIIPIQAYPEGCQETVDIAAKEKQDEARPAFQPLKEDLQKHEVLFLGYPNWWGTFPMVVANVLESCKLAGMSIYPFCTHEGSGLGNSLEDLRKVCPDSLIHQGLAIRGSKAEKSDKAIRNWLCQLDIRRK